MFTLFLNKQSLQTISKCGTSIYVKCAEYWKARILERRILTQLPMEIRHIAWKRHFVIVKPGECEGIFFLTLCKQIN